MNLLRSELDNYLAIRRALGFKLYSEGLQLQHFIDFAERNGAAHITTDLALRWASESGNAPTHRVARRLGLVRQFARFASASDPRTIVPPENLIPYRYRRLPPYVFRDEEIHSLISAARRLPSWSGLRSHTYATLPGLYTATGLRPGEPLRMDRDDVDLAEGVLTIRESKFGKSRLVPVHVSTLHALQRYAKLRDGVFPHPRCASFFLSERRTRLIAECVGATFF